jgi:cytochrome P450
LHLARLELRLALRALASRTPDMELVHDPEDIEWLSNFLMPAPHKLIIRTGR